MIDRKMTIRAALVLGTLAATLSTTSVLAAPPSVEDFFRREAIGRVQLSPSGQRLALTLPSAEGRTKLAVMDLPLTKSPRVVAAFRNADIGRFAWVNDERLVYEATDFSEGIVVRNYGAGTFAVNQDGKESRQLIAWHGFEIKEATHIVSRVLDHDWEWDEAIDDGSDDIWVHQNVFDGRREPIGQAVARLNTSTGLLRPVPFTGLDHVTDWLPGPDGTPAIAQTSWDGRHRLYWRESAGKPWSLVQDSASQGAQVYSPRYLEGTDHLIVSTSQSGEDALYSLDLRSGKLSAQPLVAVKGFDLEAVLEHDRKARQVVGLHFVTDRPQSYWFDDDMDALQKTFDASLPAGRNNRITCGRCKTTRYFIVHSSSDTQPGEYYLYDRQSRKLELIGPQRPWLAEASQGRRSFHRIAARDGLSMPVYVTHPAGSKASDKLPAVLLVHGGPWLRGSDLDWDQEAQFLASRGYRVVEPEFRGSSGYGQQLFSAGIKQQGLAMQDDLADAVQWAVGQGIIDEKRVCIMGASYGGYAALMGPIKHPGMFRCAISFAGVTDLELKFTTNDSDLTDQLRRYTLPLLLGDPETDRERMRSVSPWLRAGEIKVPVLLAHGAKDRRVPIEHSEKFAKAARAAGVKVDFKVYDLEGHGFAIGADKVDYYRRVEAFLAMNLAAPPQEARP